VGYRKKTKDVVVYNGSEIEFKDNKLVNLTRAWKAVGSPKYKQPKEWLRHDNVVEFIEMLAKNLKVVSDHLFVTERGKGGGTYAHWKLGLAFSAFLNPEIHSWFMDIVKNRFMETENHDLVSRQHLAANKNKLIFTHLQGGGNRHPD
jgi:hypothetical protein